VNGFMVRRNGAQGEAPFARNAVPNKGKARRRIFDPHIGQSGDTELGHRNTRKTGAPAEKTDAGGKGRIPRLQEGICTEKEKGR